MFLRAPHRLETEHWERSAISTAVVGNRNAGQKMGHGSAYQKNVISFEFRYLLSI